MLVRSLHVPALLLFIAGFELVGCGEETIGEVSTPISSWRTRRDGGTKRWRQDAATIADSGAVPDSGTLLDSGVQLDSGTRLDSGNVADSGSPADAGSAPAPDATTPDAAPAVDAGFPADSGTTTSPDSGATVADAGSLPPRDSGPSQIDVPLTVRETAGTGSDAFPVAAVIPLPAGRYTDPAVFQLFNAQGAAVPAQFEVLNRHWAKDNSLRHVMVHFQPTVGANQDVVYHVKDNGPGPRPAVAASVTETAGQITLSSGVTNITVQKSPFAIVTPRGTLRSAVVNAAGQEEVSFAAGTPLFEIEERGPMRVVLRAEVPATISNGVVRHGWALRLYLYAGKSYVKLDFQLQNSEINEMFGRPMFFDSLTLELPTGVATPARSIRAESVTTDALTLAPGALDTGAVQVMIRHFWETWPNGLAVDSSGKVSIELFPSWSARRNASGALSSSGLYWLDDMQHVVKEVLLNFASSPATLDNLARTFLFHPVATVPVSWYADTQVTLDMGGYFPARQRIGTIERKPSYARYNASSSATWAQRFGWDNFGIDLARKTSPAMTGGWPYAAQPFFLTESPAEYYAAEDFAIGELNIRPIWLAQYDYARDYARLKPTDNPYGTYSWRWFDGSWGYSQPPGYLPDTAQAALPRDDEHGWYYHVEEAYYVTGNPWIRDWYKFVGQFRRTRVHEQDPWPDHSGRAIGHSLSHALQAYRITGDVELLNLVGQYLRQYVLPMVQASTGGFDHAEAVFQLGYLGHAMVTYLEELPAMDQTTLNMLGGFVRWNMNQANFGYYVEPNVVNQISSGTSFTFGDPQVWYGKLTGNAAVLDHVDRYDRLGLGGGSRPYVSLSAWAGDYAARISGPALLQLRSTSP